MMHDLDRRRDVGGKHVARRATLRRWPLAAAILATVAFGVAVDSPSLAGQQPAAGKSKAAAAKPDTSHANAAQPDTVQHFSGVVGVALDSLHGGLPLEDATVSIIGSNRHGTTDALGEFRIDSVPPGEYRLTLSHPELDTLGLAMATQPIAMPIGRYAVVRIATPAPAAILNVYCPKEKMVSGPTAVVGRVLDADTDAPDSGARVNFTFMQLQVSAAIGVKHLPTTRQAVVDEHGVFSICGVPAGTQGKLSAMRSKEVTAEVPITTPTDQPLALAMLHVASPDTAKPVVASTPAPGGRNVTLASNVTGLRTGRASVTGKVTDQQGRPLEGVNVSVQGAAPTTETTADGTFNLHGLPAGTQALVVKHLGFAMTETTVDLSNVTEKRVDVKMPPAPPMLAATVIEGKRDKGLRDVGYSTRAKAGLGQYLTEDQIAQRQPTQMTDLFTQMRGIRVDYSSGYPMLTSSRDATGGCVSYVIDGVPTQMPDPQDFNDYMHPDEVSAVEVYTAAEAPAQFQTGGNSSCEVIVIWTKTKVGG